MIDAGGDWRATLQKCLHEVAKIRRSQPGNLTLRLSVRASPVLRQVDEMYRGRSSRALAVRLERSGKVTPRRARIAARAAFEITASLLDFWNSSLRSRSAAILDETCRVIESLLVPYIDHR